LDAAGRPVLPEPFLLGLGAIRTDVGHAEVAVVSASAFSLMAMEAWTRKSVDRPPGWAGKRRSPRCGRLHAETTGSFVAQSWSYLREPEAVSISRVSKDVLRLERTTGQPEQFGVHALRKLVLSSSCA
jgi:hypothetical protein